MPMNRSLYPPDWPQISRAIRERAGDKCEWCGRPNRVTGVVLTVAHLNHTPADCRAENLAALCQACHLRYDHAMHMQHARETRMRRRAVGSLPGTETV